ncbi:hypothetical protein HDU87_006483 [Geranomyces variabilis]|uniref:HNH nuclease domain-containing protein n=1 Tax=Geranomyces variabilis TaxID=109894 RepID=A0AAD5TFF3_9FUNG|nr:hypothetical protein HDU87_006483 [Geranomyces variabilis]
MTPISPPAMLPIVNHARELLENYFAADPSSIGSETPAKAYQLLTASLTYALDQPAFAQAIIDHQHELVAFSRDLMIFFAGMRAVGGRAPAPAPSRPQSPTEGGPGAGYRSSSLARQAGERDGFCCFSGVPQEPLDPHIGAHIIPFAISRLDGDLGINFQKMLACYSPDTVINSTDIDPVNNVITLIQPAHAAFGRFMWVVDVDKWTVDCLKKSLATTWWVKATRASIQDAPFLCKKNGPLAPNADYLRLHASLGKVLWMSGRAEELVGDDEDPETFPEAVREPIQRVMETMAAEDWRIEVAEVI